MSPALTFVLNLIGSKISYFSILKDFICAGTAVPNVSTVFWNIFCSTTFTIIPGGGLLLNFFLKWLPIIVLAMITAAMIKKNNNTIDIIFVDLFIF